jgi:Ca2+/H+ antiporter
MFSVLTISIPGIFNLSSGTQKPKTNNKKITGSFGLPQEEVTRRVLGLSHGAAIINFTIYGLFLFFQLKTHKHLFESEV